MRSFFEGIDLVFDNILIIFYTMAFYDNHSFLNIFNQPSEPILQSLLGLSRACGNGPGSGLDFFHVELLQYLRWLESLHKILLVSEDEQWNFGELFLSQ